MGTLLKVVLFTSPVLFLLFYYVVSQQNKLDIEMQREDAIFEREWNEFKAAIARNRQDIQKYKDRAEKAEKTIEEIEKEKEERKKKIKQLEEEAERLLNDKKTMQELERRYRTQQ